MDIKELLMRSKLKARVLRHPKGSYVPLPPDLFQVYLDEMQEAGQPTDLTKHLVIFTYYGRYVNLDPKFNWEEFIGTGSE